jgi:hypothetical protein
VSALHRYANSNPARGNNHRQSGGNIRRDPSCLNSDTSHIGGNRTEEKYEHTN